VNTGIRARPAAILLALLVAALGLVVGCGGAAVAPSRTAATIVIDKFTYQPASLTVAPGTQITVMNRDSAAHTVTGNDESFDSGTIAGGQRGEITAPSKPGSYPYICTVHPYMTGMLIVK
jgi:plastocyanin